MTPFIIFVLILTFGYLIYFTVMITLDLHGKKDERKVEEENIDVSEFAEESPVVVDESDDPQGGALTYTEEVDDDGLRVVTPSGNMDSAVSYEENENTQSEQEPEPNPDQKNTHPPIPEETPPPQPQQPPSAAVPPAPAPSQARVDVDKKPSPRSRIKPEYPEGARQRGEEGVVKLELDISANGTVDGVRIVASCGFAELDQAAVQTAKRACFVPARRGSVHVPYTIRIPIRFRLKD